MSQTIYSAPRTVLVWRNDLPFSTDRTGAVAISGDGRTVLGTSRSGNETLVNPASVQINQTVIQSAGGRSQGLGAFIPLALSGNGRAALLLDGSVAPATWSAAKGIRTGADYGEFWLTQAEGLSEDGSVIAGAFGNQPARFSETGGLFTFGYPAGRTVSGVATSVSADGTRFAGSASSSTETEAFLYDSTTGYTLLGDLPGGAFESVATAISPGGGRVVGYSVHQTTVDFFDNQTNFTRPFAWTAGGGMVDLGELGASPFNRAYDVNDRAVTVGVSGNEAFIHHPLSGMISLKNLLTSAYGLDLTGINLLTARAISDDNRTVAGLAEDNGTQRGYIVTLPNFPADALATFTQINPLDDTDADGFDDLLEVATGSDPFNASSTRGRDIVFENPSVVYFEKPPVAASGQIEYVLEYTNDLSSPWSSIPLTILENSAQRIRVSLPTGDRGFVRLRVNFTP